jgi:RNA polymerase II elongation factor ELL
LASNKSQAPLRHYASVEGKILVKRELDDKISSKVKRSTEVSQQQAKARPIRVLNTPPTQSKIAPKGRQKKKPPSKPVSLHVRNESLQSNGSSSTTPARVKSPLPNLVSTPRATSNEAQANMRYRLVHFLALAPRASADVIQNIGGGSKSDANTKSQISTLLSEVTLKFWTSPN